MDPGPADLIADPARPDPERKIRMKNLKCKICGEVIFPPFYDCRKPRRVRSYVAGESYCPGCKTTVDLEMLEGEERKNREPGQPCIKCGTIVKKKTSYFTVYDKCGKCGGRFE